LAICNEEDADVTRLFSVEPCK